MYKQIKKVSIEEMNEKIEYLKKFNRIFKNREPEPDEIIGRFKVFLFKKISTVHLIYKDLKGAGKVIQLSAHLDREFDGIRKNGAQALGILQKYFKAPKVNDKGNAPFSIGIKPYRNPKYIGTRTENCYGYDLNSAYPYGMLQDIPDTLQPLPSGIVKDDNEYSFTDTGSRAKVGMYSKYRFVKMESPYKKFVETWYNKKLNASDKASKNEAKFVMNAAIGALQNTNCYIRAAIINNFHKYILDIFYKYRKYILSMNVDSIVSTIRIPELDNNLGPNIGQWKLEHEGCFAIHKNGFSVQWNNDAPAFGAGISKSWFSENYDILVDDLPQANNIYDLDFDKKVIKRRK